MGVKILDLPEANASTNNDLFAIVQAGETKKVGKSVLMKSVNDNIASEYSTASTYLTGDYCIYNGQLYRCLQKISTPEEFNASHWEVVYLASSSDIMKNSADTNANNNKAIGVYLVLSDNNSTNYPTTNGNGILIVMKPKDNTIYQIFSNWGGISWVRTCWYGTWNSWRQIAGQNDYSTEEARIGTWINGNPLYRKVINVGALPNNTTKTVSLNINNLDIVTKIEGIAKNASGTTVPIPIVSNELTGMTSMYIYQNSLNIQTASDRSGYNAYVTVEYTKTTD